MGQGIKLDHFILRRGEGAIKGMVLYRAEGIAKAAFMVMNATTAYIVGATCLEADGRYSRPGVKLGRISPVFLEIEAF